MLTWTNSFQSCSLGRASIQEESKEEEDLDIMQKLENAITNGNHKEAASLAKEVSKLQISTKLSLKELTEKKSNKKVEKIK